MGAAPGIPAFRSESEADEAPRQSLGPRWKQTAITGARGTTVNSSEIDRHPVGGGFGRGAVASVLDGLTVRWHRRTRFLPRARSSSASTLVLTIVSGGSVISLSVGKTLRKLKSAPREVPSYSMSRTVPGT